jgi:hypothetical protein
MRRLRSSCVVSLVVVASLGITAVRAQLGPTSGSGFLGDWCAQGNKTKHCSITSQGMQLTLTNENGSTSPGMIMGSNQNTINAMMWNGAIGTLSADGKTINWSNGTFWARCGGGGGGGGGHHGHNDVPGLAGTWFVNGEQSRSCQITQNGKKIQLRNEQGSTASGSIRGKKVTTIGWPGNPVGTLTNNGNRIDWSNGTSWTR